MTDQSQSASSSSDYMLHELKVHQIELELQNEELRRTQLQLEASRARYFDLYDLAPVGYFTLSETGIIQEANGTAANLLGVLPGALVDKPLNRFVAFEDQDAYYRHRKQLVANGVAEACELRMKRSDGEPCWVLFDATTTKDASGALMCRAVLSDINARKRAEETLRASEKRHRTLFEQSHDALMTLSPPDWRLTSANATAVAMFGARDEASFISQPSGAYSPERQPDGGTSAEKATAMIEVALRDGSRFGEWTYRRLSGEVFPATVLLTRVELDGQPLLQVTVRDETEVKRLQALLSQADRVASMGMLAAGVAHEINNPLTYVLYNIDTLAKGLPKLVAPIERCLDTLRTELGAEAFAKVFGEDAKALDPAMLTEMGDHARAALSGAERIRHIAKAIGTFSRVEKNERARVDLNYAIECATTMISNDIKFRARLIVDLGVVPAVWASEGKLSQVFLNLLINAAQAIEEGHVQENLIQIRTWVEGDDVLAEIKDTGKGISKENLGRVFDPFFTTKPIGVGSGLGLPICRNIVTEFGGDIQVESQVGKGTRVVIRFPIQRGVSGAPKTLASPTVSSARGRVLVVDDEPAIRAVMVRVLRSDHEVVTAASGAVAKTILEKDQAFDVIVCDLMMPDMTGMDLHRWLAAEHPALAARVVFMTGGAFTPKASEYLAKVGNKRLEKPYGPDKLTQLVSELVAVARSGVS